jgi:hypothetical protein
VGYITDRAHTYVGCNTTGRISVVIFVDTCSVQVQIDYREVVQIGYRSVVQVVTVVHKYISQ